MGSPHSPGDRLDRVVSGLSHDGQGVVDVDGMVAFVPGALPSEHIRLQLQRRSRRYWTARLEAVLQPSPQRRRPPCILAERCGGCSLQHWQLEAQQQWKRQKLLDTLRRIGHFQDLDQRVGQVLAQQGDGLGYRNRAILPLERRDDGTVRAGYYRAGSHTIVNLNHCPVLDSRLDSLLEPLKQDLERSRWPIDRHLRARGGLRHLALRVGHHTGEVLLTLISSREDLDGLEQQAQVWMKRWPQLVGVCLNIQDRPSNTLLGPETRVIAGRGWLQERFAGLAFQIGADTFFQVNTPLAEAMVPLLASALSTVPRGYLIDAYCGIGTFALPFAALGWNVLGIELSPGSVGRAEDNAAMNGLSDTCRFLPGPVGSLLHEHLPGCEALFVDPPRKGLEASAVQAILQTTPQLLLYLSCDPATLARDLACLAGPSGPYSIEQLQPIDLFPQTSHLETLATLRRTNEAEPQAAFRGQS